jgi:hypothetical protein
MLVVSAVLLLLLLLLMPLRTARQGPPVSLKWCMSNLRQIGLAMQMFAQDNDGQFPRQTMATNDASSKVLDSYSPAVFFVPLAAYIRQAQVWICPTDKLRLPATNYAQFDNRNLSYFLSLNVTGVVKGAILAGDRHLKAEGQSVPQGFFSMMTNSSMGWTHELHSTAKAGRGGLLFADAHSEIAGTNLAKIVRAQPLSPNRLAIP